MVRISAELKVEVARQDCFLCRPNAALLVNVGLVGYLMAGLGPLADGYAVVATHQHLRGLAEVAAEARRQYAEFAQQAASMLVERFGGCLVVEHGNMAVCGIAEEGREHCFHPHFLLIPDARCNTDSFLDYFGEHKHPFNTLAEAINFGVEKGQYVLVGKATGPFYICLPTGELPRQFARALVAEQLGVEELASWRDSPNPDWALSNAFELRKLAVQHE